MGLVDAVVPPAEILNAARRWALDIAERRKPWVCSVLKTDKLPPLGEAREILKFAREQTRKQAPNLKHPLMCLEAVEVGIVSGPRAGLKKVYYYLIVSFVICSSTFPKILVTLLRIYTTLAFTGSSSWLASGKPRYHQKLDPCLLFSERNYKGLFLMSFRLIYH